jgi:DNA polymerase III delta prime subunit
MTHYLQIWKEYLTNDDYEYLIQYVENIKTGVPNDKMLILAGPPRTGKTMLKGNIAAYLGHELCGKYFMSEELIYDENIKSLVFFCGIDELSRHTKCVGALINFIKYKQSFITETNYIERVNARLFEHSRVIRMEHVFQIYSHL